MSNLSLKRTVSANNAETKPNAKHAHSETEKGAFMQEYLNLISEKHKEKLLIHAKKHKVTIETALRNIICYLKSENCNAGKPSYLAEMVTGKQIEGVIDTLA